MDKQERQEIEERISSLVDQLNVAFAETLNEYQNEGQDFTTADVQSALNVICVSYFAQTYVKANNCKKGQCMKKFLSHMRDLANHAVDWAEEERSLH
jgi:hypothetical protein